MSRLALSLAVGWVLIATAITAVASSDEASGDTVSTLVREVVIRVGEGDEE